jgi:hypothetical protein
MVCIFACDDGHFRVRRLVFPHANFAIVAGGVFQPRLPHY